MRPMPAPLGLYIHIPFCKSKCVYCDFYSLPRSESRMDDYTDALCAHLAETAPFAAGHLVDTVYFGGGTPTTLSAPQLDRLMGELADHIDLSGCTEYTVEAGRPDTITAEKLAVLRTHGVTRVSVNPQTFEENVLRAIGRCHTAADIDRAMERYWPAGGARGCR